MFRTNTQITLRFLKELAAEYPEELPQRGLDMTWHRSNTEQIISETKTRCRQIINNTRHISPARPVSSCQQNSKEWVTTGGACWNHFIIAACCRWSNVKDSLGSTDLSWKWVTGSHLVGVRSRVSVEGYIHIDTSSVRETKYDCTCTRGWVLFLCNAWYE